MACPQLGVILAYWKQTGVSSPKNPIALAVGVSNSVFIEDAEKQLLLTEEPKNKGKR